MTDTAKNPFQQLGKVKVIKGSILAPENSGLRFVLNVNNMGGTADNPLYPLFDKKWPKVKQEAKGWFNTRTGAYKLGATNTTAVQSDVWVIHLLCQDVTKDDKLVTDAKAVATCLKEVCKLAKYERATVHVSNMLTDAVPELTGALNAELIDKGISVYVYQEPGYEPKPVEVPEEPVETKKVTKKSAKGSKVKRVSQ